ncbi:hypothetical protein [Rhizobium gallicum]|uniref:hypothetical protein n=1 Tax=Rhizobium gallicum TaxID=56730 RepID=UPI000AF0EEF5|nr:hypothetical protein [Rhizobium gallicum]
MSSDILTVSYDVVGNIRIASFKSVRICAAHQAIHSLMNDACKIFQHRRGVFLIYCSHVFGSLFDRLFQSQRDRSSQRRVRTFNDVDGFCFSRRKEQGSFLSY